MLIRKSIILSFFTLPALALFALPAAAQDVDLDADDDDVKVRTRESALPEVRANSPSGRFGTKGQKAISSDAGLSLSNTSISGADGSTTNLTLRPAVDWFFADSISVGGFVGVEYISSPSGSSSAISVGPRLGYNVPLSERMSIWPKLGVSIASTSFTDEGPDGTFIGDDEESNTSLQLNLFAPVMFHPVQHFFLGLGPALDLDLSGENKATTIAVRLTLGGWV